MPKDEVGAQKPKRRYTRRAGKRGPGRPKGSKNKVGRPKGSKRGRKPGRPKGAGVSLKGYVRKREAKRIAKEAVAAFKARLPKLITKELKKLLR